MSTGTQQPSMRTTMHHAAAVCAAVVLAMPTAATPHDFDYDVVVYGSTPGGISAAVAAGTLGLKTALYEPLSMIGGMVSGAVLQTRLCRRRAPRAAAARSLFLHRRRCQACC